MSGMPRVELRLAYEWTCEHCGRDNFARATVHEWSPEEMEQARIDFGFQPWDCGQFVSGPSVVQCSHCGAEFVTHQVTLAED